MGFILAVLVPEAILMFSLGAVGGLYILGGVLLFCMWIFTSIRYVIAGDRLHINVCGICNAKLNIADVVSIKRSYNLLSSPAASMKRLEIRIKSTKKYPYFLISPVCEQEFLDMLKAINPDIVIQVSDKKGKWRIWDWDI
jgi:hypothetical protein